jgi:hypothetical protein
VEALSVEAHPLQWPLGWPRTPAEKRNEGRFTKQGRQKYSSSDSYYTTHNKVTIAQATQRIQAEISAFTRRGKVWRIDPDDVLISSNLELRRDGLPRSGQRAPADPGVAVYFELDGKPQCIPCDAYTDVAQNLAAVAATLSALRTLERHGSGIMERAFTGFEALPHLPEDPWWVVLGLPEDAPMALITKQYRKMRSDAHPDRGGDATQFDRIEKAYRAAVRAQH